MTEEYYSPMLENFRKWASLYDPLTITIRSARRAVVKAASPERGGKILDVCTGTGAVAFELSETGASVTGIDLSGDMLERARRKRGAEKIRFLRMNAVDLMFPPNDFDAATISFGLHEMPAGIISRVLREVHRVAKHRLVVIDYKLPESKVLAGVYRFLVGLYESPFCMKFLELDLSELVTKEGFELEKRKRVLLGTCQLLSFRIVK